MTKQIENYINTVDDWYCTKKLLSSFLEFNQKGYTVPYYKIATFKQTL